MDPQVIGVLVGGLLGLVNLVVLWSVGTRMAKGASPDRVLTGRIIKGVALVDVILFMAIGYFVGPMVIG